MKKEKEQKKMKKEKEQKKKKKTVIWKRMWTKKKEIMLGSRRKRIREN
uniref:Uncharacterized protein n=1 Tax=Rhizophora mucronata TaxID=61149 RepID=A0A2P2K8R5_RHIMU